jgi:hypothetical protein
MSSPDRYALVLAMLEGDREARRVLADLLEDQGERGLAQWAREGRNRAERRLDLAIMLLPCKQAILLGAEFCDACLKSSHFVQDTSGRTVPLVMAWVEGAAQSDAAILSLTQLERRLEPKQSRYFSCAETIGQLIKAMQCAAAADRCAAERASAKAAHWHHEAGLAVRAVSYYIRRRTSVPEHTDRLKDLLSRLLSA